MIAQGRRAVRLAGAVTNRAGVELHLVRARARLASAMDAPIVSPYAGTPVVVIGMHRSGTTMVTRMLESLGVFMGAAQLPSTSEAVFFFRHNVAMLRLASAGWDRPDGLVELLDDPRWCERFAHVVGGEMERRPGRGYWGRTSDPDGWDSERPWGWKDPRNSLTLPVWTRLFPRLRVVRVVRDADAVAASLAVRSRQAIDAGRSGSLLVLDGDRAIRLREGYLAAADAGLRRIDGSRHVTIRYEDVLADPVGAAAQLRDFAVPAAPDGTVERAASTVRRP